MARMRTGREREQLEGIAMRAMARRRIGRQPAFLEIAVAADIAPVRAAIAIGTLAAALALGLRLWIPGLLLWVLGHSAAVFVARADPDFMAVAARSIRHKEYLSC